MSQTVAVVDIHGEHQEAAVDELSWRPSAYGIVLKDDHVLLCPVFGHKYDLPGGGVEFGEQIEEALVREVKEETGIDVANPRLLDVHSNFFTFVHGQTDKFQTIMLYYVCDAVGGELSNDGHDEFEQQYADMPEWVPISQLASITLGTSYDWRPLVEQVYANSRN